jgi:hypothetical protein
MTVSVVVTAIKGSVIQKEDRHVALPQPRPRRPHLGGSLDGIVPLNAMEGPHSRGGAASPTPLRGYP